MEALHSCENSKGTGGNRAAGRSSAGEKWSAQKTPGTLTNDATRWGFRQSLQLDRPRSAPDAGDAHPQEPQRIFGYS
jgi:hypothetical protein